MSSTLDPLTALAFSIYENKGVYALLIGSGVSRAAQIPTGWEIVLELTKRVGALEEAGDQEDWAVWYKQRFGSEPNYSELLSKLSQSPDERRAILHRFIEPTAEEVDEGIKVPTKAHRAIARLVRDGYIRVIITTNFDRLLENALREVGVEPTVIRSDDDLRGAVPLIHSRCYVVKVHGDYLDTRILNTDEELAAYSDPMNKLLDRIFDEHGLIVCGWSAEWDHALRAAITRAPSRRYPFYYANPRTPGTVAQDLIEHRVGRFVQITDADSFFQDIQRKVEVQAALQRANPESVELLVATAKKYLSRPEFRIELYDLVADEMRRLKAQLGELRFDTNVGLTPEEFTRRIELYESRSERLVRLFAVLGRWGDGSEFPLVKAILQDLGFRRSTGGLTVWIKAQWYPAILLLYAYGIGALRSDRLREVYNWLTTPLREAVSQNQHPAVQGLFSWTWDNNDIPKSLWTQLIRNSMSNTGLSDRLYDLFSGYLDRDFISKADFTREFGRFEMLASLAYTSTKTNEDDLRRSVADPRPDACDWLPLGKVAWQSEVLNTLLTDLDSPAAQAELAEAGFGTGNAEFVKLSFQNMRKFIRRHIPLADV
ncbi:SIR2 family protein [Microvirga arsenatis]|uniref:Deacetylase sirtuin-type domain-containing protein n=1 Tax=Microvirga arsenatis TaxID=2692265 RepID=A0ABW9Z7G5_9HYPH|nr:SIR2 family protein [Microvirga arsenatis]NBJ13697.1 hypothetical protein [Microvirga arsenatis]NBJ27153.1 hypothetical protein [Microvirga arsenatis]